MGYFFSVRLRDSTGETRYYAPSEVQDTNLLKSIRIGMCHIFGNSAKLHKEYIMRTYSIK